VGAWQVSVYGGHRPEDARVFALCDGFDAHLGASGAAS